MKPWRWPKSLSLLPSVIDKLRQQQKQAAGGMKPWSQHKDKESGQDVEAEDGSSVDGESAAKEEETTSDEDRQPPKAWDGSESPQTPQTTDPPIPSAPVQPETPESGRSSDDSGSVTPPTPTPKTPMPKATQQPAVKDQDEGLADGGGLVELRPPGDKGYGKGQVVISGGFPKRVWSLWRRLFRGKGRTGVKKMDETPASVKLGQSNSRLKLKQPSPSTRDSATAAAGSTVPSSSKSALDAWRRGAAGSSAAPDSANANPNPPTPKSFPVKPRTGTTTRRPNGGGGSDGGSMAAMVRERMRGWAEQFWYRPVIDYAALRRFAIKPFQVSGHTKPCY